MAEAGFDVSRKRDLFDDRFVVEYTKRDRTPVPGGAATGAETPRRPAPADVLRHSPYLVFAQRPLGCTSGPGPKAP